MERDRLSGLRHSPSITVDRDDLASRTPPELPAELMHKSMVTSTQKAGVREACFAAVDPVDVSVMLGTPGGLACRMAERMFVASGGAKPGSILLTGQT